MSESIIGDPTPSPHLALRALDATSLAVLLTDATGKIVWVNSAFARITGWRTDQVIGQNPKMLQSGRHDPQFYTRMWRLLLETGHWEGEIWNRRPSREVYPEWIIINAIVDDGARVTHYLAFFTDITARKAHESRLQHLAYSDPLTGLTNRCLFDDRFRHALAHAARSNAMVAFHLVDLDCFKAVNDRHGHRLGDELLCAVAARLLDGMRASDTVARLGGDEFAILQSEISGPVDAERLANRILDGLADPFEFDGLLLSIGASIGISLFPLRGSSPEKLMERADMALYRVKAEGKHGFQISPVMALPKQAAG